MSVLNLLPSKGNIKMKGAKPKPAKGLNNEKTKLERGQSPLNATPKSENPEVQINRNENVRDTKLNDSQGSQAQRAGTESIVLIGKLKPLRSRRQQRGPRPSSESQDTVRSRATSKTSAKAPAKTKQKKQKKMNEKPPRVRYDRSTKKLLQQEEENKAKRKKEAKEIATKARQKAIEADKLKQEARSLESSKTLASSDPTTTQMGSFKLAGSKPKPAGGLSFAKDDGKNKIGIMSYAPTISLYKDAAPVDARAAYGGVVAPLYQDPFTRRLEAYAKRELDPSVVSYLNTFVARNLLRSYADRGVNTSV